MEYLTGDDRKYAVEMAKLDAEYGNLQRLYEMTDLQLETHRANAEVKVFEESGTYDDLEFLYREAEAAVQEDKRNVLQRIFDWFKNFFKNIGAAIRNSFNGVDPNAEVQVQQSDLQGNPTQAQGMLGKIISAINPIKDEDGVKRLDMATLCSDIVGVAVGTAAGAKVFTKIKAGELKKTIDEKLKFITGTNGIIETCKNKLNELSNVPFIGSLTEKIKTGLDTVKSTLIDPVNKQIQNLTNALKNAVSGNNNATAAQKANQAWDNAAKDIQNNQNNNATTPEPAPEAAPTKPKTPKQPKLPKGATAAQRAQAAMNTQYESAEDDDLEEDLFSVQESIFGEAAIEEAEQDPEFTELAELFATL